MLSKYLNDIAFPKRLVSLADKVAYSRPLPLREFDQIYMMSGDMLAQVELVKQCIAGKRILFLGDGDGMSMLFGLLAAERLIPSPQSMTVLDFDKRILANISRFGDENGFKSSGIALETRAYNVIDPPPSDLQGRFDFFYINPPYGSRNAGLSTVAWLHRCIEMCGFNASGCIVVPYDFREPWSQKALLGIQRFLTEHSFVVRDMVSNIHAYHLEDNPVLQSASIVVDWLERAVSEYTGRQLPAEIVSNLYGGPRRVPHFIDVDERYFNKARLDYGWGFGEEFWDTSQGRLDLHT